MQAGKTSLQNEKDEQIQHSEDLASKFAMQFFGTELLRYFGIRLKISRIEPTEYVHLELKQLYEDFNFRMEDGSCYHLEFESDGITKDDLRRFREYEAVTSRTHRIPVITYVLCSAEVKNPRSSLKEGINTYRVKVIQLKGKSADLVFDNLESKKPGEVRRKDLVSVTIVSLLSGKMSQLERAIRGIKALSREYPKVSKEDLKRMQAALYVLADKFLTRVEMEKVKEVCAVNAFLQMYVDDGIQQGLQRGIQQGLQQGKAESVVYLLSRVGTIASELSARILNEKNEETLEGWLSLAAKAKSVEQFEQDM